MGRDLRSLQELMDGPADAPDPDRYCRGTIAAAMTKAAEQDVRDIMIEVRLTDSGTTTSHVVGEPMIVKATQDPGSVSDALLERLIEQIPDTWSGQIRVNLRDRQGGAGGYLGSCVRHLRPAAPSSTTIVDGAPARGVVVLREPDAVRPWADANMRMLGHIERMAGHMANMYGELQKTMQPREPQTLQQAVVQMLPALMKANQGGGQAPAAQAPPPPMPASSAAASWPFDPPQGQLSVSTSTSTSSIDQPQRAQGDQTRREVTIDDVRAWAAANPDGARALVFEAIQNGAS